MLELIKHKNQIIMQPTATQFLEAAQRIRPYIHKTPVLRCNSIDQLLKCRVYFKCENFQKVGAYKARGASNKLLQLGNVKGVVTHSSGNHGQALAYITQRLGVKCYVVMPKNSPEVKRTAVKGYLAEVVDSGNTQVEREQITESIMKQYGLEFVHPYNDWQIITGAGTAAMELFDQVKTDYNQTEPLDYIIFPIGGGGLASGTLLSTSIFSPRTKKIGVQPYLARDAYLSLQQNSIHPQLPPKTVADGLRTSLGSLTFPVIRDNVDEIVLVTEGEIIDAMQLIWERMKILVEPSSATVLAAARKTKLQGKTIGLIISGGNVELGGFIAGLREKFRDQ